MTLGYFKHCNFVDAGNGLMSHYPVKKIDNWSKASGRNESMVRVIFFFLGWLRYAVKLADSFNCKDCQWGSVS